MHSCAGWDLRDGAYDFVMCRSGRIQESRGIPDLHFIIIRRNEPKTMEPSQNFLSASFPRKWESIRDGFCWMPVSAGMTIWEQCFYLGTAPICVSPEAFRQAVAEHPFAASGLLHHLSAPQNRTGLRDSQLIKRRADYRTTFFSATPGAASRILKSPAAGSPT